MASMVSDIETLGKSLKRIWKDCGIPGLTEALKSNLDSWRNDPLNVAIIGNSGTGKSSFINALRDIDDSDDRAAEIGETESGIDGPVSYEHPNNSNLRIWDLPGVGTPSYPKETYMKDIEFDEYDFFIIISCTRFTENDLWLAQEIKQAKKHFFFIRSKIDEALRNEKRKKKDISEEAILDKILNNCLSEFDKKGINDVPVFLISNHHPDRYDFDKVRERLMKDFPQLKRESIILSMSYGCSHEIVNKKLEFLRGRIEKAALLSMLTNLVPIPGLNYKTDITSLMSEAFFFASNLGLDDRSLERLADVADIPADSLKKRRHLLTEAEIIFELKGTKGTAKTYLSFIPIFGTIANLNTGTVITEVLNRVLNEYVSAAHDIIEFVKEAVSKKAVDVDKPMNTFP